MKDLVVFVSKLAPKYIKSLLPKFDSWCHELYISFRGSQAIKFDSIAFQGFVTSLANTSISKDNHLLFIPTSHAHR